jgi:hypothetical protein
MGKPPQWKLVGLILYDSKVKMTLHEINEHPLMLKWYESSKARFPRQQTQRRLDMRVDWKFSHVTSTRENNHLIFGKSLDSKFFLTDEGRSYIESSVLSEFRGTEWVDFDQLPELFDETLILGTSVWDLILGEARKYIRENKVFKSQRQNTPYNVTEATFDAITVGRVNGGDNVSISRKLFVSKAQLVEEYGPINDKEISTTTAIKTSIVELHPYLSYHDDFSVRFRRRKTSSVSEIDTSLEKTESREDFDVSSLEEARERIVRAINIRRGQGKFRRELLAAYSGKCCITGCDTSEVIEAAHIIPYRGAKSHDVRNGLLLRSDLHTLFDRCMIWVDTESWSLIIDQELKSSQYSILEGVKISLPDDKAKWPSIEALNQHKELCDPSFD